MKKGYLFILFILLEAFLWGAIPAGYYNSAEGKSGYELKTSLYTIIKKGHNDRGYSALYDAYKQGDTDPNDGYVWDIYSENPNGSDPYNFTHYTMKCGSYGSEGDCYNREHIVPQSIFNSGSPMKNDYHHVFPTDGKVNGMRSSYPFGEVSVASWTSRNGSKKGSSASAGYAGTVFEPIDEYKGDVARSIFYFVTRYETQVASWHHAMFNGTSNQALSDWFLAVMLKWHKEDPVSQKEIVRNDAGYNFQGNRNPYVDHPEYIGYIWGGETPNASVPTAPSNLTADTIGSNSAMLRWIDNSDNETSFKVFKNGTLLTSLVANTTSYNVGGLESSTSYQFYIEASNSAGSAKSNNLSFTTGKSTVGSGDLFFSEYLEGSDSGVYNKALEIYNPTTNSINLSDYIIKTTYNGSDWYSNYYSFPSGAMIGSKDVYVVVNNGASAEIRAVADDIVEYGKGDGGYVVAFTGNDARGLFKKNGASYELIDVIGKVSNSVSKGWNVAGTSEATYDHTLIRKAAISKGNINWTSSAGSSVTNSEWEIKPKDSYNNLGSHLYDSGTTPITLSEMNATYSNGKVLVAWVTASESNVLCYNLYRAEVKDINKADVINSFIRPNNTVVESFYEYKEELGKGTYYYWLEVVDSDGKNTFYDFPRVTVDGISIGGVNKVEVSELLGAYPNPFNPTTNIKFNLKEESNYKLSIYNLKGHCIKTIRGKGKGNLSIVWNGKDNYHKSVASGIYFYRLDAGNLSDTKKMMLLK